MKGILKKVPFYLNSVIISLISFRFISGALASLTGRPTTNSRNGRSYSGRFRISSTPQGDVNDDGAIDVLDVVIVIGIIIETHIPTDDELAAADMNNDGMVDVLDIVILVNAILGD